VFVPLFVNNSIFKMIRRSRSPRRINDASGKTIGVKRSRG